MYKAPIVIFRVLSMQPSFNQFLSETLNFYRIVVSVGSLHGKVAGDPYTKTLYWSVLARAYIRGETYNFNGVYVHVLISVAVVFESRKHFWFKIILKICL